MFVAIPVIISPNWKQSKHPTGVDKQMWGTAIQLNTTRKEKEIISDIDNNMDEFHKHYAKCNKPYAVCLHFYNFPEKRKLERQKTG